MLETRNCIVTTNRFNEMVAFELDFMRDHNIVAVLLQATPSAHMSPSWSDVEIGLHMFDATI